MVQCFSFGVCLAAWAQALLRFRVSLLRAAYARSLSNQLLPPPILLSMPAFASSTTTAADLIGVGLGFGMHALA